MLVLYNIFSLFALPFLLVAFGCRKKYRHRLPRRLGWGLRNQLANKQKGHPTLWVHALSVGEVTSAVPLLRALRANYPQAYLLLSVSTATGRRVAEKLLRKDVDAIIDGPVDFLPTIRHFLATISPDLYILVETDFWPNLLHSLNRRGIPAVLVNGRISARSMRRYQSGRAFFLPMFQTFSALAMQTANDREKMRELGLAKDRLPVLGNLKFATVLQNPAPSPEIADCIPQGCRVLVAGSTHPGEETILLEAFRQLRRLADDLFLVLVPRNPGRGPELTSLAEHFGFAPRLRSQPDFPGVEVLVVDTIGELLAFYAHATLAFVGGSLVAKGGHNPLEPASLGVPVLFGPHMEDFSEIAELLREAGGAQSVHDGSGLVAVASTLLRDRHLLKTMGETARQVVVDQGGDVIGNHLQLLRTLL